jgi:hypothetical protein
MTERSSCDNLYHVEELFSDDCEAEIERSWRRKDVFSLDKLLALLHAQEQLFLFEDHLPDINRVVFRRARYGGCK